MKERGAIAALALAMLAASSGAAPPPSSASTQPSTQPATSPSPQRSTSTNPIKPFYSVDFSKDPPAALLASWSQRKIDREIREHPILGRFMDEQETLTLKHLPAHTFLRLKAQLLIIDSWDGSMASQQPQSAPDCLSIKLDDGRTLMCASFINFGPGDTRAYGGKARQSYPDNYPLAETPGLTGSDAHNVSWVRQSGSGWGANAVYTIDFTFPHTAENVAIDFKAFLREPEGDHTLDNESWGLGKVDVEALAESPVHLSADDVHALYQKLDAADPVVANDALRTLISAGDAVVNDLQKSVPKANDLRRDADRLIANLDDDSYDVREQSQVEIIRQGHAMLPFCDEALRAAKSPEAKARLDLIVTALQKIPADRQAARLRRALEIIGSDQAVKLAKTVHPEPVIPSPSDLNPKVPPPPPPGDFPDIDDIDF